jgi:peptidoglycan/xylan/chitin deacetylase (PgdA/CDA1 family)
MRHSGSGAGLVGLTFDDGYADFAVHAVPILGDYGFTATVFPVVQQLGQDNAWDPCGPRKPLLTCGQFRQVARAGMEIGSHGLRHVPLTGLTDEDVDGFCYPWGQVDGRVADRVRAAGYGYGCAIARSSLTGRYALPRGYIGDADSAPRLWAKGACHWAGWDYSRPGGPPPAPPASERGATRS